MTNHNIDNEAIQKSWLNFAQAATDSFSLYDFQLNLLEINDAGLYMFPKGTRKEDIIGLNIADLVPGVKKTGDYNAYLTVLETGEPLFMKDIIAPDKFGHDRHLDTKAFKVGEYLGIIVTDISDLKRTEKQLRKREAELENEALKLGEANTALRVILRRVETDKLELEEKVLLNVKDQVLPYLNKIKQARMIDEVFDTIEILETNLKDIVSSFSYQLSICIANITPSEIIVANLIKSGKTSKEIAGMMNSSLRAIEFHRANLRKKLGLNKKKINLQSYLLNLE